jgi:L-iditol 2-dehydrogenase
MRRGCGSTRSVKASVYHGPGDLRIEEVTLPQPGPGEVLVRMLACGVCGSDLLEWYVSQRAPVVLGHEPVGEVVAVGQPAPKGSDLAVGTRVVVHHHVPCFVCDRCRRGHHTLCETFKRTRIRPGGFAEQILVPAENARLDLLPVPEQVPVETATLTEPLACCLRAQRRAGVGAETRLLVVGAGQMGLLHVQAARARGCRAIVVAEPLEGRREAVARYGALPVEAAAGAVLGAMGARPDVVIVCTGKPDAVGLGMQAVDDGGLVQLFAPSTPGTALQVDPNEVFFRELTIQASYSAGPLDTREALRLLAEGVVTADGVVTHRFPLADTARALETARSGQAIKVVVLGDMRS